LKTLEIFSLAFVSEIIFIYFKFKMESDLIILHSLKLNNKNVLSLRSLNYSFKELYNFEFGLLFNMFSIRCLSGHVIQCLTDSTWRHITSRLIENRFDVLSLYLKIVLTFRRLDTLIENRDILTFRDGNASQSDATQHRRCRPFRSRPRS
jgi:hypothetical protein